MKNLLFGTAILLTLAFSAFGQKAAVGKPDPTKDVRDAFERLIDGIKQVDVDKVMASYEKSDRLLIFNNNGSATLGWETVKGQQHVRLRQSLKRHPRRHRPPRRNARQNCRLRQLQMETITGKQRQSRNLRRPHDPRLQTDRQRLENNPPPHLPRKPGPNPSRFPVGTD